MKILYYSSHPNLSLNASSGPGTHMREMINAFRELGHEVLPIIMGGREDLKVKSQKSKIKSSTQLLKKFIPGILWRTAKEIKLLNFDKQAEKILEKKIKKFNPHLVYERGAYMQLSGVNVVSALKIKHIIEINAPYLEEVYQFEQSATLLKRKAIAIEKQQIQKSNKVVVVSSPLNEYYSQYTDDINKIVVVPNGIDAKKMQVDSILKENILKKYDLLNKTVIGFVGSIFPYHGVDLLIKAVAALYKEHQNIALMIVGDGMIIPELKKLSEELNILGITHFTGSIPHKEVPCYIDAMDITVLPQTNYFCSPVKIFEYGVLGKAIICADTPAVRDVMENNKDGLLIGSTINDLTAALKKLLSDPATRKIMGECFKTKVHEKYTWHTHAQTILS